MKYFFTYYLLLFVYCSPDNHPNVIFILTDDQGMVDLGVYGASDISTPNLDQLALGGAYFTSYYATQPVCQHHVHQFNWCYPDRIRNLQCL